MSDFTLSSRMIPTNFNDLNRVMIGLDNLFNHITWAEAKNAENSSGKGYPPYNVFKRDESHYAIELAVSGFGENDLGVVVDHTALLAITGEVQEPAQEVTYMHRGLSHRKFRREFRLVENVNVVSVTVRNGIMTIELERVIPESQKPRVVAIDFVR